MEKSESGGPIDGVRRVAQVEQFDQMLNTACCVEDFQVPSVCTESLPGGVSHEHIAVRLLDRDADATPESTVKYSNDKGLIPGKLYRG